MGTTEAEYQRLTAQARMWEEASARLLDRAGVARGARCVDVGCGTGETMRLLADRAGPSGSVVGVDLDPDAGDGEHPVLVADVEHEATIAGAPFDVVFARLLLLHVADPAAVLRRLWTWVAPGGALVVQDFDLASSKMPPLESTQEFHRVVLNTFAAAGTDLRLGRSLPVVHRRAGIGEPDGTDVTGRLVPLATDAEMLEAIYRSMQPAAIAFDLTTAARSEQWVDALWRDAALAGEEHVLWPLMVGTYKRR